MKAGAAHIAFDARSRTAVRDFYAAALNAGGRPNGAPAVRNEEDGYFNAAVLDFDGNSVEVVYRDGVEEIDRGSVIGGGRVLQLQGVDAAHLDDVRSVVSSSTTVRSKTKTASQTSQSVVSRATIADVSKTLSDSIQSGTKSSFPGQASAKAVVGTLIGAAAGAALVYAACKSESESAREEAEFLAWKAKAQAQTRHSDIRQPPGRLDRKTSGKLHYEAPPPSALRAIERAPAMSYHMPTYTSVPPSTAATQPQAIEYTSASAMGNGSRYSVNRSFTNPVTAREYQDSVVSERTTSTTSQSTLVDTFVPSEAPKLLSYDVGRRSSAESVHSHRSARSKAKSRRDDSSTPPSAFETRQSESKSSHSRSQSKVSRKPSRASSRTPSAAEIPIPSSVVSGSNIAPILGRSGPAIVREPDSETDTVAPSDSISCAGGSVKSKKSGNSTKSKSSSKHSKRSSKAEVLRPYGVSDTGSDASTVKPFRKNSVADVTSAVSLPIRVTSGSSVDERRARRSVVSFAEVR